MRTFLTLRRGLLAVGLAACLAGRATASAEVDDQVRAIAGDIKKFLDTRGQTAISMGMFLPPPQWVANPGPGLGLLLTRELRNLNVTVKPVANLGLSGEFREQGGEDEPLALELKIKIVDNGNRALQVFSCGILDAADIAWIMGANTRLPDNNDGKGALQQLRKDLQTPPVRVQGGRVSVGSDQAYAVQLWVGKSPRPAHLEDGMVYAPLARKEIYVVELINNTQAEAAVDLTIDGINVYAFNEDADADGKVRRDFRILVRPGKSAFVRGWYWKGGRSYSFQVTDYPNSVPGLKRSSAGVGAITACFRACRTRDLNLEVRKKRQLPAEGTGKGPVIPDAQPTVQRQIGPVRAVITVRYAKD